MDRRCRGGLGHFAVLQTDRSDPVQAKFAQGEDVFRKRRSLFFKKMQIVRGCDAKRNVLVYMVYSDKIIEGSPKNSTSSVPIMPWGSDPVERCGDWVEK
jgi:CreA protein